MACYHPLTAYKAVGGGVTFKRHESAGVKVALPCGRCIGCRIDRSRQWAVRCVHEASLYEDNSFITLTYAPDFLPEGGTLIKRHFQLFMKRLRKIAKKKIRYYHCGEYGEELGRPHYHALLFGYDFPDKILWKEIRGNRIFTSGLLDETWGKGFCSVGAVSFQSAAYVARYILKKQLGRTAPAHYQTVDEVTGEIFNRLAEYTTMSLKPGIGSAWFDKFNSDVYPADYVVLQGKKFKTPRYYDKLVSRLEGEEFFDVIKAVREESALKRAHDNTAARLLVRETVHLSKLRRLGRELDET